MLFYYNCSSPLISIFHLDNDECSLNTSECDPNANCSNTLGSYECVCRGGFEGDGRNCTSTYMLWIYIEQLGLRAWTCYEELSWPWSILLFGWHFVDHLFLCLIFFQSRNLDFFFNGIDLNECDRNPCHSNATCTDTLGSYECQCKPGFSRNGVDCVSKYTKMFKRRIIFMSDNFSKLSNLVNSNSKNSQTNYSNFTERFHLRYPWQISRL